MSIFDRFKRKKDGTPKKYEGTDYAYDTEEHRVATVQALYTHAKDERSVFETEWRRYNEYYNFKHTVSQEVENAVTEAGLPWIPAVVADPWIQVESQIDPVVPAPEFTGRDADQDSKKAKVREYVVKYVLENNPMDKMNTANERRLLKYGDSFWKAYWDQNMGDRGDIRIKDVPIESLFVDPSARDGGLEAAWYVNYTYPLHKMHFRILYADALRKLEKNVDEIIDSEYTMEAEIFTDIDTDPDVVTVLEHWFRQPDAGSFRREGETIHWEAGDIACVLMAGGCEIGYIPKYWENTNSKRFPFVHSWRIHDENGFYNKSELFALIPTVDAADRELAFAELNDALMGNDVILVEEGALAEGEEISNMPGSIVKVKPQRSGGVHRLGGLTSSGNKIPIIEWYQKQIERISRNYDTNMGKETARVQTASGLAQLRQDASEQSDIKKADRLNGYKELFELVDALCLEFFDDDRMIYVGAKTEREKKDNIGPIAFNASKYILGGTKMDEEGNPIMDENGQPVIEEKYIPKVDVTVSAGDGIIKSKGATLSALDGLAKSDITPQNYKIILAEIEILDIPQKQDIIDFLEGLFAPKVPPEVMEIINTDPEFAELITQQAALRKVKLEIDGGEDNGQM